MTRPVAREDVERLLPELRRFARLVCGDARAADHHVGAALKQVLAGCDPLADAPARERLFSALILELPPGLALERADWSNRVLAARLAALPETPRRLLLLTDLAGFDLGAAARALALAEEEASHLRTVARTEMLAQPSSRVLIIEDNSVTAINLADILEDLTHDVVGIAGTRAQAEAVAKAREPGLVLADIELADGVSGMRAAAAIRRASEVPVVFVTGHPERLPTAGKALTFVTKPFDPETIALATAHALARTKSRPAA
jgi:CheY-like chemotaxis protein